MNSQAQAILTTFDSLSERVRHEVALEILRRTKDLDLPSLTDAVKSGWTRFVNGLASKATVNLPDHTK